MKNYFIQFIKFLVRWLFVWVIIHVTDPYIIKALEYVFNQKVEFPYFLYWMDIVILFLICLSVFRLYDLYAREYVTNIFK
tara:strand:+ start:5094 stop:5333 length:240 start_codon:yes stop_codon:yes gene_type:complete